MKLAPLEARFGRAETKPLARSSEVDGTATVSCTVGLGRYGQAGSVSVVADFVAGDAQTMFAKQKEYESGPFTDTDGVGAGSYAFTDPAGIHLVTYDGNLHLAVVFRFNTSPPPGGNNEVLQILVQVATQTMAELRTP